MKTKTRLNCPNCSETFNQDDAGAGWVVCTVNNRTAPRWCCPDCRFEAQQRDLSLSDAQVIWAGQRVLLMNGNKVLADITADNRAVAKIKVWCLKNAWRCSAVRDGRIWL